ncbi:MAG: T9SS type A sorting domain-containing protein [Bacteroidota bacterium]
MYRVLRLAASTLGLAALLLALPVSAQDADVAATSSGSPASVNLSSSISAPFAPISSTLYSNGPLINSVGTGVGGADESVLQDGSLSLNTFGYGHQAPPTDNSVADDFTVPTGGWDIDEMIFYAYQTTSPTTSTITGVYAQIWDGDPSAPGSSIVWGDLTTNILKLSAWSGIYRVTEGSSGTNTDRPIMANTATVDVTLPAGTYWVEWQTAGSLASGPWAPPITITGSAATGNGLQRIGTGGTWASLVDGPTLSDGQGMPFQIIGPSGPNVSIDVLGWTDMPQRNDFVFIRALATNNGATTRTRVYFTVDYPNGATRTYSVLSSDFPANSSFQVQQIKRMKFPIPADAPGGTYTVTVYAADDIASGGTIYDTDMFTFDLAPLAPKTGELASGVDAGPNPFTTSTTIRYELAADAEVDLRVYDATGREVAALVRGTQTAGAHSAAFAAGDLPSGVYVWRLAAGGEVTTGRVTLAR